MTVLSLPEDPEALLQLGRELLAAQVFSSLLEARLDAFRPGLAELSLPLGPHLLQQYGHAHGGVVSYLADNAMTFAGGSVLGPAVTTVGFSINYLRPAQGERLAAEAIVVSGGRRLAVVRCDVSAHDEAGRSTLCAVAQGTIATIDRPSS
ncbi:PaaI family thioesterase [Actinopolymorpha sp. NPDC004070]|uniref:PaaI family thioesterase n=1 Tax=Actinopolymorpha sp. NPDC004070 TaxID=3154548 RepID=UPI0033A0CA7D